MRSAIKNGILINEEDATLPVTSRSMQYAYSVYEALKLKNGEFVHLEEHYERLKESARGINIELKYSFDDIKRYLNMLKEKDGLYNETFRILLVGKENGLFITHNETKSYPDSYYSEGVDVTTYHGERFLPNYKTSNLLLSYLALEDAENKGAFEALLINRDGYVTEGTRSNFYGISGSRLYTAPDDLVLSGITRISVIRAAEELGFEIVYTPPTATNLHMFDSLFISSTSMGALPVATVNGNPVKKDKWDSVHSICALERKWE